MKNKLLTFCLGMGIPVSSISVVGSGCTGACGSCNLNCTPGIVALMVLLCRVAWCRLQKRMSTR